MYKHFLTSLALLGPLAAFALQMQAGGAAITRARADEPSQTFYPGRYAANCKPVPIGGCVCEADPTGKASTPSRLISKTDNQNSDIRDVEYLRLIEWLRLTCNAIIQSEGLR